MAQHADVDALKAANPLAAIVGNYVKLEKRGHLYVGLCPFHNESTPSLTIYPDEHFWCYGCGAHGDVIDFLSQKFNLSFTDACARLNGAGLPTPIYKAPTKRLTTPPSDSTEWLHPVPSDATTDIPRHALGTPWQIWDYRDAHGNMLYRIARFNTPTGKEFFPLTYRRKVGGSTARWTWKSPPTPRPLYGLDRLAANPTAPVLVVEGERACDAAQILFPKFVCMTWPGGANAVMSCDWSPIVGRRVCLWPDADKPGIDAMQRLAPVLAETNTDLSIVDVSDQADGWDLADALAEGWDSEQAALWARARVRQWDAPEPTPQDESGPPIDDAPPHTLEEILEARHVGDSAPLDDGDSGASGRPIMLNPDKPLISARAFVLHRYCLNPAIPDDPDCHLKPEHIVDRVLYCQSATFYAWNGNYYPPIETDVLRAEVYGWLDNCFRIDEKTGGMKTFDPTKEKVNNVVDSIRAITSLEAEMKAPAWLRDPPPDVDAGDVLPVANGLLHLPTEALLSPTPDFWGHNALPFAYDPNAPVPRAWLAFLDSVWGEDPQSIECLQDQMGYYLTPDTSMQKIFLIVGPKRSGKGTIGKVITALIGAQNVVSPTLSGLMKENSGVASMIDKQLAIIGDARLDARADQQQIAEKLLSISGEDSQTIDRKYLPPWSGKLNARFLLLTNIMPRISDASGALSSRFVILTMTKSFYDQEDQGLADKLLQELPGILNWAIVGWKRLKERGKFVVPASSAEAVQEMADLSSPILAFLRDRCMISDGRTVSCDFLYEEWCQWCKDQGREHVGTKPGFGRELHAAVPGIKVARHRNASGGMSRMYEGLGVGVAPGGLIGYSED